LVAQIRQYPDEIKVVKPAVIALSNIVFKNSENANVVMESKIVEELFNSKI